MLHCFKLRHCCCPRATLVKLEDLVTHLRQVADAPDSAKLSVIRDTLTAMDTDNDGAIKVRGQQSHICLDDGGGAQSR